MNLSLDYILSQMTSSKKKDYVEIKEEPKQEYEKSDDKYGQYNNILDVFKNKKMSRKKRKKEIINLINDYIDDFLVKEDEL